MKNPLSTQAGSLLKATKVVGIAADHAGYELKEYLVGMLREAGAEVIDFGDSRLVPEDDYPDFVVPLARAVAAGEVERGVAICGSGVGASVAANKVRGARACLIHDPFSAHQGVEDDDLNLICLGGSVVGHALAWELVRLFLCARFSGKERNQRRLDKVLDLENQSFPLPLNSSLPPRELAVPLPAEPECGRGDRSPDLKLYLIRHGETEWSLSGQYTGSTDLPLTVHGEAAAIEAGERLADLPFTHVLVSPLQRALQTCHLAALIPVPTVVPDLTEWGVGDFEGRTLDEIQESHPGWNLFHDGAPHGESVAQISARVDRLIEFLRPLRGNVALFSHGHLCRVLAARWIGLSVAQAGHLLLDTASISILAYGHDCLRSPSIERWNSVPMDHADRTRLKRRALDRWENEGGREAEPDDGPVG